MTQHTAPYLDPQAIGKSERLHEALARHPRSWIHPALPEHFYLDMDAPCATHTPLGTPWPEHTRIAEQFPELQGPCVTVPLLWGSEVLTAQFSLDGGTLALQLSPGQVPVNLLTAPTLTQRLRQALNRTSRVLRRAAAHHSTGERQSLEDWRAGLSVPAQALTEPSQDRPLVAYEGSHPGGLMLLNAWQQRELEFHLHVQAAVTLTQLSHQLLRGYAVNIRGRIDLPRLSGHLAFPQRPSTLLSDAALCRGFPELRREPRPMRFIRQGTLQRRAFERRGAHGLSALMRAQLPSTPASRRQVSRDFKLAVKQHGVAAVDASLRRAEQAGLTPGHLQTDPLTVTLERHFSSNNRPAPHIPNAPQLVTLARDIRNLARELAQEPHLYAAHTTLTVPVRPDQFFAAETELIQLRRDHQAATQATFERHLRQAMQERGLQLMNHSELFAELPDHWTALINVNSNRFLFQPAASAEDLRNASHALHHCVGYGSYTHGAQSGEQPIIRVFQGTKEVFTAEVNRATMSVAQARGKHNRDLTDTERRALNTWLKLAQSTGQSRPRSGLRTQKARIAALGGVSGNAHLTELHAQASAQAHARTAEELRPTEAQLTATRELRRTLLSVSRAAQDVINAAARCWDAIIPNLDLPAYGRPIPGGKALYRGQARGVATLFDSPYGPTLAASVRYLHAGMHPNGVPYQISTYTRVQGRLGVFVTSEPGTRHISSSDGPGCPGTRALIGALIGLTPDQDLTHLRGLRPAKLTTGQGAAADQRHREALMAAWAERKTQLGLSVDPDGVLNTGETRLQVKAQWRTLQPKTPKLAPAEQFVSSASLSHLTQALLSSPLLTAEPELQGAALRVAR